MEQNFHSLLLFLKLDRAVTGGQIIKSTVSDFIFDTDSCADPESFVRGGPTLLMLFFFIFLGREYRSSVNSGPIMTRQRNAIKMAFRWRVDDCPTLNAGLVALLF